MPKITKEFTEALGFRLLSTYNGFTAEYPVEAAKIQKIYDDDFRATCFKCYPIIAEAGVDPQTYKPVEAASNWKTDLRKQFPVVHREPKAPLKVAEEPKVLAPKFIEVGSDEEDNESTFTSQTQEWAKAPKPVSPKPAVPKPSSPKHCLACAAISKKYIASQEVLKSLTEENKRLMAQLQEKKKENAAKDEAIVVLQRELALAKRELFLFKNDPDYQALLTYHQKKRKQ